MPDRSLLRERFNEGFSDYPVPMRPVARQHEMRLAL